MNRREFGLASLGAVTTSLAGCGQLDAVLGSNTGDGSENWGAYRGDVARTGRVAAEAGPGESLSVAWHLTYDDVAEAVDGVDPSNGLMIQRQSTWPLLAGDLLIWGVQFQHRNDDTAPGTYVTRRRLVAADTSGSITWSHELPVLSDYDVVPKFGHRIDDGRIYQPTVPAAYLRTDNEREAESARRDSLGVTVLDPETGNIEREVDLGLSRAGNMIVKDGTIYVEIVLDDTGERGLYAFDAESGAEEWSVSGTTTLTEPFASIFADTLCYIRWDDDDAVPVLVARRTDDGDVLWQTPIEWSSPYVEDHPGFSAPTIDDSVYTAGSTLGASSGMMTPLVAFTTDDGTERRRYRPPGVDGDKHPLLDENRPGTTEKDPSELPPASGVYGMALPMDEYVVATGYGAIDGNADPEVGHCFAIEDDSIVWSVETELPTSLVAAGTVVYLTTPRGVTAVSKDGTVTDSVDYAEHDLQPSLEIMPSDPSAIGNGLLYVPTYDGIVALE